MLINLDHILIISFIQFQRAESDADNISRKLDVAFKADVSEDALDKVSSPVDYFTIFWLGCNNIILVFRPHQFES